MEQPSIVFEGKALKVTAIHWDGKGEVEHICFYDQHGSFCTAFQAKPWDTIGRNEYDVLHLELKNFSKEGQHAGIRKSIHHPE